MENNNIPKVSIGMPVYNGAKFIRKALDSLITQTFTDFELIISDNASTDQTKKICKQYVAKDQRIRYSRQTENKGVAFNFNFVLEQAEGEYFMWAACDDLCEHNYITELVECFQHDESLVLCGSDTKIIDSTGNRIRIEHLESIYIKNINDWEKTRRLFFRYPTSNIFFTIYGLYKTEALKKCGIPSSGWKGLFTNSEVPFLARLSLLGRIAAIPKTLKSYRVHDSSIYLTETKRLTFLDSILLQIITVKHVSDVLIKANISIQEKTILYSILFYSWLSKLPAMIIYHFLKKNLNNCR